MKLWPFGVTFTLMLCAKEMKYNIVTAIIIIIISIVELYEKIFDIDRRFSTLNYEITKRCYETKPLYL